MNTNDWKNATPEQINLWRYVKTLLVGVQTITPLVYTGVIAGSEFLTYDVKKLYLALDFKAVFTTVTVVTNPGLVTTYDQANAVKSYIYNASPEWDTTAVTMKYSVQIAMVQNIWFSRVLFGIYNYISFNGYRITIP